MQQEVVKQEMNDSITASSVGKSLLWHISNSNYFAQYQSRDFPTELCCNTIIVSLLFVAYSRSLLQF